MPLPQQKFREIVFLLLYSRDMGKADEKAMLSLLMSELAVTRQSVTQAQKRMEAICEKLPEIDAQIAEASHAYAFERIPSVERNILRLGIYELLFDQTIPGKVVIAEALRLAKKFGSPESVSFVNAILDTLYKKSDKSHEISGTAPAE